MPDDRARRLEQLALHHDGVLPDSEREAPTLNPDASPEDRAHLEAMRRIDASLRAAFAPAATPTLLSPKPLRARAPIFSIRNIAAAVLVLLLGGWFIWPQGQWPKHSATPRTVDALREQVIAKGFTPDAVCTTDEQFRAFTLDRLKLAFYAGPESGVEILGWGYPRDCDQMGLPSGTISLLCTVDSHKVLVLMTPQGTEAHPRTQWLMGDHVFRNEVGGVMLIEITPLDEPRVLPLLHPVPCPELENHE